MLNHEISVNSRDSRHKSEILLSFAALFTDCRLGFPHGAQRLIEKRIQCPAESFRTARDYIP